LDGAYTDLIAENETTELIGVRCLRFVDKPISSGMLLYVSGKKSNSVIAPHLDGKKHVG
jgi:hypothetical protein